MSTLLRIDKLRLKIGGLLICQDLSFEVKAGENWALLGRNGAGKSTLLLTLAGLRAADAGTIDLQGTPLSRLSRKSIAQSLGILLQQNDDAFPASVLDTALIGRHPFVHRWRGETQEDFEIARNALAAADLSGFESRMINSLSGGERQRLKIATLLTQNPRLCLLDEPTNHLDLKHQVHLLRLLSQRASDCGGCNLMALHDLNLAARYCTHALLFLPNGKIKAGALDQVMQPELLLQAYDHPLQLLKHEGRTFYQPG